MKKILQTLNETIDEKKLEYFLKDNGMEKMKTPCEKILGTKDKFVGLGFIIEQYGYNENLLSSLRKKAADKDGKNKLDILWGNIFDLFDPYQYMDFYFVQISLMEIKPVDVSLIDYYVDVQAIVNDAIKMIDEIKGSSDTKIQGLSQLKARIDSERWDIFFSQKLIDCLILRAELRRVPDQGDSSCEYILDLEGRLKLYKTALESDEKLNKLAEKENVSKVYGKISKKQLILSRIGEIKMNQDDYMGAVNSYKEIRFIKGMEEAFSKLDCELHKDYESVLEMAIVYGELDMLDSCVRAYDLALYLAPLKPEPHIKIWEQRAKSMARFSDYLKTMCEAKCKKISETHILY